MTGTVGSHLYWKLDLVTQSTIAKELKSSYGKGFTSLYKSALQYMGLNPPNKPVPEDVQKIIGALDERAAEILYVGPWKSELPTIENITALLPLCGQVVSGVAAASLGVTLLYARSHRVLAVATLCVTCAMVAIRSFVLKLNEGFEKHYGVIEALNAQNLEQFSGTIDNVYNELKKTSYLMRLYLNSHQSRMKEGHQGLELLREQLLAMHHLKALFLGLAGLPGSQTEIDSKIFFTKFEKLARKGLYGTVFYGAATAAVAYYAYVQRARLMVVIGIVHCIGALAIARELYVLKKGSSLVGKADPEQMNEQFQYIVNKSFIFNYLGVKNIQDTVFISLDAILKLIPAWKEQIK